MGKCWETMIILNYSFSFSTFNIFCWSMTCVGDVQWAFGRKGNLKASKLLKGKADLSSTFQRLMIRVSADTADLLFRNLCWAQRCPWGTSLAQLILCFVSNFSAAITLINRICWYVVIFMTKQWIWGLGKHKFTTASATLLGGKHTPLKHWWKVI